MDYLCFENLVHKGFWNKDVFRRIDLWFGHDVILAHNLFVNMQCLAGAARGTRFPYAEAIRSVKHCHQHSKYRHDVDRVASGGALLLRKLSNVSGSPPPP
jgi:hypothetical protein